MDLEQQRRQWRERKRRQRARAKQALAEAIANAPEPPGREQLLDLLGVRARQGHVPAMRLLLEEYRRDRDEPPASVIDELAKRKSIRPDASGPCTGGCLT